MANASPVHRNAMERNAVRITAEASAASVRTTSSATLTDSAFACLTHARTRNAARTAVATFAASALTTGSACRTAGAVSRSAATKNAARMAAAASVPVNAQQRSNAGR